MRFLRIKTFWRFIVNKEIKEKWIKDLRSGEYKKGIGSLKRRSYYGDDDEYCCLGVLTDQYLKENSLDWSCQLTWGNTSIQASVLPLLPNEVKDWAEFESDSPMVGKRHLSALNDRGTSFKEIADLIEEHL